MGLYFAICSETNNVKAFTDFESLKEFAKEQRYAYDYYYVEEAMKQMDVDVFYYD